MSLGRMTSYFAAKIAPAVIFLVTVGAWVAYFGTAAYGRYAIVWGAVSILSSLVCGWLQQSILRGAGDSTWSLHAFVGTKRRARHLLAVYAFAALFGTAGALTLPGYWALGSCAAGLVVVQSTHTILLAQLQRSGRANLYGVSETLRAIATLLISVALALTTFDDDGARFMLAGTLLGFVVASSCGAKLIVATLRCDAPEFPIVNRSPLRAFWSYGWPLTIWLSVSSALQTIDRLLIALIIGAGSAGVYAAVADVAWRGVAVLAFPVTMSVHPVAMSYWNAGRNEEARRLIKVWVRRLLAVLTLGSILAAGFAQLFYDQIGLDEPMLPGIVLLISLAGSAWQLALLVHKELEFAHQTRQMLLLLILSLAVASAFNFALLASIGIIGAAIAALVGSSTYCLGCILLTSRTKRALELSSSTSGIA
jgi:O-antigen/teichoic acid export membrane protein